MRPVPWYAVIAVFVTCVSLTVVSNLRTNAARQETNTVVCGLVAEAAATERGKLDAYRADPPTTEAGRAQQREVEKALARYEERARALRCPPDKE